MEHPVGDFEVRHEGSVSNNATAAVAPEESIDAPEQECGESGASEGITTRSSNWKETLQFLLRKNIELENSIQLLQKELFEVREEADHAVEDEEDMVTDQIRNSLEQVQSKLNFMVQKYKSMVDGVEALQQKAMSTLSTENQPSKEEPIISSQIRSVEQDLQILLKEVENLISQSQDLHQEIETFWTKSVSPEDVPEKFRNLEFLEGTAKHIPILYDSLIMYDLEYLCQASCWGQRSEDVWKNDRYSFQRFFISREPSPLTEDDKKMIQKREDFDQYDDPYDLPKSLDVLQLKVPSTRVMDEKRLLSSLKQIERSNIPYKSRLIHPGTVQSIKQCYQHPDIVVTAGKSSDVYIWNTRIQPSRALRPEQKPNVPDVYLRGTKEGIATKALDFHSMHPLVASGSSVGTVRLWSLDDDVHHDSTDNSKYVKSRLKFDAHTSEVTDCTFHPNEFAQLCSVGADRNVSFWDTRYAQAPSIFLKDHHSTCINSVSWNRCAANLILTGSEDGFVQVTDIRMPHVLHKARLHQGAVSSLKWSPHYPSVFASSSLDGSVYICDLNRIDSKFQNDRGDLAPEILFSHALHLGSVRQVEWNLHEPWMLSSLCDQDDWNNGKATLHIWRPSDFLVMNKDQFANTIQEVFES